MNSFSPNVNFKHYMWFIEERMNIFWLKYSGDKPPYTKDEILSSHKFTNVYRVLDRSSQYLLKNVIYNGKEYTKEDMIFRILLYKHFNLPSTWEKIIERFGDITVKTKEEELVEFFSELTKQGVVLYSNAYMITAAFMRSKPICEKYGLYSGMPKYQSYMRLIYRGLFEEGIMSKILKSKTMEECFNSLMELVGVAEFLAYQFVQDFNYTDFFDFDDNSFCAAGPGTQRGIERCFNISGKPDYQTIVKWVHNNFEQLCNDYKIDFISLPNHLPRVPDLSNCFCETSKYLKGINPSNKDGDKRIKNLFHESSEKIDFIFPSKWGVNIKI